MAEVALRAEVRGARGKGPARRMRASGRVPAILYGRGLPPVSLAVEARDLRQTLATDAGVNVLIDLQFDGETHLTLARAIERHPVRGEILHVDFLKIARDVVITVDVPVHFEGESHGVKEGGVLEHHLWQLHLTCLPADVPERITVDVAHLGIGDSVRVREVASPEGVTILTSEDEVIVSCVVPQVLRVEEEVAAAPVEGEVPAEGEAAPAPEAGKSEEG